jgi:proline racemase
MAASFHNRFKATPDFVAPPGSLEIKAIDMQTSDKIHHPFEPDLSFLYGTIFIDDSLNDKADSRNVCVFADGEVDRSPTGSGVSGRMAIHHAKNQIKPGQTMTIESILGSTFIGEVASTIKYGPFDAVIPKVSGNAFVCGVNHFIINPDDPLKHGFLLR